MEIKMNSYDREMTEQAQKISFFKVPAALYRHDSGKYRNKLVTLTLARLAIQGQAG